MQRIYTGSYTTCKVGNLISISGDRGRNANFKGKAIPQLAPKRKFWEIWHKNIGIISEEENTRYYIEQYYIEVLSKVDIEELLRDEEEPILLCYEESTEFCHRHIVAEYINIKLGIEVFEIEIREDFEKKYNERPQYIRVILEDVIRKYKKSS